MNTLKIIIAAIIILFLANEITAQITIDGNITDSDLNPISNALVEIIDEVDTSNIYSAMTNQLGYFNISVITNVDADANLPKNFITLRNYPNPFNPSTTIYYELPKAENVEIIIYDILGREVRILFNNFHKAGTYTLEWDGRNSWNSPVAAGIYFCRLKTKDQFKVHKMVLLDGGSISASTKSAKLNIYPHWKISKLNNNFNFSVKISGDNILESEFKHFSCTSDTTLNLLVPKLLQKSIIGPEGGKLETEDFSLTIPEGALISNNTISLYSYKEEQFRNNAISNSYRISGLPNDFSKTFKIHLRYNKTLSEESFIVIGEEGMDYTTGESEILYDFIEPIDSSGFLVGELPGELKNQNNRSNSLFKPSTDKKWILVYGISDYITEHSEIFKIYLPRKMLPFKEILASIFDNAFVEFKEIGFKVKYPVPSIYLANLGNQRYCNFVWRNPIGKKKAKGIFAINYNNLKDETKLYNQINKEILRFFLFCYDPLYPIMVGPSQQLHYWLNIATSTWSEELFTLENNEDYFIPADFPGNETAPFNGLQAGIISGSNDAITNSANHGNGMSVFLKYIIERFEPGILVLIYDGILAGMSPIEAFNAAFSVPLFGSALSIVWNDFFFEYLTGGIYNVTSDKFLNFIPKPENVFRIDDVNDTSKIFSKSYKNYSAKLFEIDLVDTNRLKFSKLSFKVNNENPLFPQHYICAFGQRDGEFEDLGRGTNFRIDNLTKYKSLIASVINCGDTPPYTNNSNINFEIKVKEEHPFKHCDIKIAVQSIVDTFIGVWSPAWYTDGTFTDNVYNGIINPDRQGGSNVHGTVRIEIDNDFKIVSLDVMAYHSDQYGSSQWGITASNIPMLEHDPYLLLYRIYGTPVCSYVTSIYAKYTYPDGNESEISQFSCEEESLLQVKFHNWD